MEKEGPEMTDEVMTIPEVAEYLKVTRQTVHRLMKDGKIKAFKIGRSTRIMRSEIERFIQGQIRESNGQLGDSTRKSAKAEK